ncbi:hypothetical protein [Xanthomonas campestris]|uniref:hypothetical protein n=1 Tax=Xanthomonas campestris TaxID=339 RepID=UPI0002D3E3BB|nr:hypothetical protein [Xanthomonas campestris]MEA9659476.1 hypothetical protein [Xanthomonas campestris pv. raphani]MEA9713051.1 hypothetical protein [Xanthomonas campestris]MEA9726342.1 hypothetical protein [Xanthomonas campestris pv. raphani]MEA9754233.1 hypothetical protein [Xanthomonas campestris pv. raphani]MEA9764183.1 hypothetical protein [Xanthomonas campestris pv. raphani]
MNHVRAVLEHQIHVTCAPGAAHQTLLTQGAATSDGIVLDVRTPERQAEMFSLLQSLQLPFADAPAGWPPAAVFSHLRERGWVYGPINTVTWAAPEMPVLGVG